MEVMLVQQSGDRADGVLVREARAASKLTAEACARLLGVPLGKLLAWEEGREAPPPEILERLQVLTGTRLPEPAPSPTSDLPGIVSPARTIGPADSGWPPDERERRDFYHRIREFPEDVARWRTTTVRRILASPAVFPAAVPDWRGAQQVGEPGPPVGESPEGPRALLDEGISHLREIARMLALLYGTPDLGNKSDPVDELIYIILSRKTREQAYQEGFSRLKARFVTWDSLLEAEPGEVQRCLEAGGLGEKKTLSIFGALSALRERFGSCTLEPARSWSDAQLEEFLCALPEIQRKSAFCIMMYALGRKVFPVDTHVGRVLARLGPYRELGLDLDGLDHKRLQLILADLIPPNLRHSLHVNLVMHGRSCCTALHPRCDTCEIRLLCRTYRNREVSRAEASGAPLVIDLFCGAGGLSSGFLRAGFRVGAALDTDPVAMKTYRLNHPAVPERGLLCRDIRMVEEGYLSSLVGAKQVDVLIGAPPCQGFSQVGHRSKQSLTGYEVTSDERNFLFDHLIRAAVELQPRLVLMENVPGMRSAKKDKLSFMDSAASALEQAGYRTTIWQVNAVSVGVPQDRVRCFLVASRTGQLPEPPPALFQDRSSRLVDPEALPPTTLEEAIFDLPAREADDGLPVELWEERPSAQDPRYRRYLARFGLLSSSRLLFNHTVRYHNQRDLELYALLRPGEDSIHALERHGRADLMTYRSDVFDDKYARLRADRPCKTIVAHLAKDGNGYIHPTQPRSLSFREAARVQSFADDFVFTGSPSDQWKHLGNSVPPLLGEAVARQFMAVLRGER